MLVLARKRHEELVIDIGDGRTITITVVRHSEIGVRLGVTAPPEIQIHRREVYEAIKREEAR